MKNAIRGEVVQVFKTTADLIAWAREQGILKPWEEVVPYKPRRKSKKKTHK